MKRRLFGIFILLLVGFTAHPQTSGNDVVRYTDFFRWKGSGKLPAEVKSKLQQWHTKSFAENRRLVITNAPEKENAWKQLLDNGADSIAAIHQQRYRDFYKIYKIELEIKGGCHCVRM